MNKTYRVSELTFADLCNSAFGGFIKVVYNGNTIYEDLDEGPYIDRKLIKGEFDIAWQKFIAKYSKKQIYSFYCLIKDFHHTEVYIEGE